MSLFEFEISIDDDVRRRMTRAFERDPGRAMAIFEEEVMPFIEGILDETLRTAPPRPNRPIEWQSERQRIYMLNYYPGELPYERSGELIDSWRVNVSHYRDRVNVSILSEAEHMPFVQGVWQQFFHHVTGWSSVFDVRDAIESGIDGAIERAYPRAIERVKRWLLGR